MLSDNWYSDNFLLLYSDQHSESDFKHVFHESNSPQEDMPIYPNTLLLLLANQFLFLLLIAVCLEEKQQIPVSMSLVLHDKST